MKPKIARSTTVEAGSVVGDDSSAWDLTQIREGASIGRECDIGRNVFVDRGVVIGDRCKVQNNTLLYAPAELADGVFIGPAVVLTNDRYPLAVGPDGSLEGATDWQAEGVRIETGVSIGAASVLLAGVNIGSWRWLRRTRWSRPTLSLMHWSRAAPRSASAGSGRPVTRSRALMTEDGGARKPGPATSKRPMIGCGSSDGGRQTCDADDRRRGASRRRSCAPERIDLPGPGCRCVQSEFSELVDGRLCVAVSSGTSGLHVAGPASSGRRFEPGAGGAHLMTTVRMAVICPGMMGRHRVRLARSTPGGELVGVHDPLGDPHGIAGDVENHETLEGLIESGMIATPTDDHLEVGRTLASAGVHLLIEKPLAIDVGSGTQLLAAIDEAGVAGAVGHVERFNPAIWSLKRRLMDSELGELYQISTSRQGPFPDRTRDVGVIKDLGTHDIDLTMWISGEQFTSVSARVAHRAGRPHEDLVVAIGELSSGLVTSHEVNWLTPTQERRVVVTGAKGRYVADTVTSVVIIVVPLVVDEQAQPDFGAMDAATKAVAAGLQPGRLVSYETTLPVGRTRNRFAPALAADSGLTVGDDLFVVHSPERVFSGRIFDDLRRHPKLVGGVDPEGARRGVDFCETFLEFDDPHDLDRPNGVWDLDSAEAAEMAKLAETTYRDLNIAYANEFAKAAEKIGVNVHAVIEACNTQRFSHIHQPGISVGGHCIPVYPHFLLNRVDDMHLPAVARRVNGAMPAHAVEAMNEALGGLRYETVVILGLAYRPGVKEHAFSGTSELVRLLEGAGARTSVWDPLYPPEKGDALGLVPVVFPISAAGAVVHTAHEELPYLDEQSIQDLRVIYDDRGVIDPGAWPNATVVTIGSGRQTPRQ